MAAALKQKAGDMGGYAAATTGFPSNMQPALAYAADAGGAAEIVDAGTNALTHPPGDAEALTRALAALIADEGQRARLGAAARTAAVGKFDAESYAAAFADVYESVALARGGVPA